MKRKPKIAIAMGSPLPVPSVLGGAIEELMTMLCEQNEIEQRAKLYVYSCQNAKAKEIAKNWKHTKLIQCPKFYKPYDIRNKIHYRLFGKELYPEGHYFTYLNRKLIKGKFDYVVFQDDYTRYIADVRKKIDKEKLCLHIHYHYEVHLGQVDAYGKVFSVTNFVKKEFERTNPYKDFKSYVVYNAIRNERFEKEFSNEEKLALRNKLGIKEDDFMVLFCGRILQVKGVLELIKAIVSIDNPKIKLVIVGSTCSGLDIKDEYEQTVEKLCNENADRIIKTGYVDNDRLPLYYQTADVMCAPPLWEEAAGLVFLEAITSGTPVIATKSGGLVEMVNDKCAILLDKDDKDKLVKDLAKAILELYSDGDKRKEMAKEGKLYAKNFSQSKFYNDFINSVLD